jgi:hypothetical protein
MGKPQKPIKVCLTNGGKDSETPWATDLGPAPGPSGSRKVRLVNVPFLHAKPTWGDVIVVSPADGFLTWDRKNVPFTKVATRILEDSGRWAMILDYAPHPDGSDADAFKSLARACAEHDIVCEGAWGPRDSEPGRAYLAVKAELTDVDVMERLRAATLPCELIQIHPAPKKPRKKPAAKKPAKPAAKKPATKSRAKR